MYNKWRTPMELVIGESVKETNRVFIKDYTQHYCKAITENYRMYHIDSLTRDNHPSPEYAQQQLDEIENGTANLMKFEIREGKKYYKIVQVEFDTFQGRNEYRDRSVHSFVDKNNGNVYKPASWKAPHTKHVRFSFQKPEDIRFLLNPINVGWAGGYLYLR
tara:strand:+ start:77 stop:559 length:483 start_codon:yes stop_codon:yes gene_type:complete